jgi:ABC-type branched-subunit amino acid transport system ATPase component
LLDEPASGMGSFEIEKMEEIIRKIREMGITIVVVSHEVKMLMNLSEIVTVLSFGQKIAEDIPEIIQKDPRVLEAYLGTR